MSESFHTITGADWERALAAARLRRAARRAAFAEQVRKLRAKGARA